MNKPATPEDAVVGLIGLKVWGGEQTHGSFLELQFGEPKPDDPERGANHLWIYMCAWRIEHGSEIGAGCEDTNERIAAALNRLNGRTLTAVTFRRPSWTTTFEFGDHRLITFGIYTDASERLSEQWLLFRSDNLVLSVGPGSAWRLHPADQP